MRLELLGGCTDNFLSGCEGGRFLLLPAHRGAVCWCWWMPALAAVWRHGALGKAGKEVWIQNTRWYVRSEAPRPPAAWSASPAPLRAVSLDVPLLWGLRGGSTGSGWLCWVLCGWYSDD